MSGFLLFTFIRNSYLRGEGGSSLKKWKFFVLSYVVAQVLVVLKWAHLSLNSKRLSRYDATKLTRSDAFSRICIGNPAKFVPNFDLRTTFPAVWLSD